MTTSIRSGSTAASASSAAAARTERSLACSSSAAMCLPRRPNFSTITCSGMPLRAPTSAAVIQRSGRYDAVAVSETRTRRSLIRRLEDAPDDPRKLLLDVRGHCTVAPEDVAHAEELSGGHQRPGGDLRVDRTELAALHRFAQALDVALGHL